MDSGGTTETNSARYSKARKMKSMLKCERFDRVVPAREVWSETRRIKMIAAADSFAHYTLLAVARPRKMLTGLPAFRSGLYTPQIVDAFPVFGVAQIV